MRGIRGALAIVLAGAGLLIAPAMLVLAQESGPLGGPTVGGPSISGPTIVAPATTTAPAAPTTASAGTTGPSTQSAESSLESLLHSPPSAPSIPPTSASPMAVPPVDGTAPHQPTVQRIREGQMLWNRVGRLVKDEKTGQWLFAFESDGKEMKDPPMVVIPSKMREAMEEATDKGSKSLKFKVSGQVLEYRGKNHLWIQFMQQVKDMNQF